MTEPVEGRIPFLGQPIVEAAEVSAEQLETVPYALGATGAIPSTFTGAASVSTTSTTVSKSSLLPTPYDLEWVQGDTAEFPFLFTDVFWMEADPGLSNSLYDNAAINVTAAEVTSNVATITTDAAHGYSAGFSITVAGCGAPYDGTFRVLSVTSTTLTYEVASADLASSVVAGTVEISNMPVYEQRSWAAEVRAPYIFAARSADAWVPVSNFQYDWWRGNSLVASFTCTGEPYMVPATSTDPVTWGTKLTIVVDAAASGLILPGGWYRWDLQTKTADLKERTWLRGRARIITEWTTA